MSGESLTALLRRTKQTLCVPAAEYVPAMGDAMLLLDRAIQMSYQTDPCWLSSSAAERAVVEARREALEEAAKWIELVGRDWKADGQHEKRFAADYLAAGIRALSPPVG